MPRISPARGALCAALSSLALLAVPAIATADCANADLLPSADNIDQIRDAVICLQNDERAQEGLRALRPDTKLQKAATGHSQDMVKDAYFAHDSEDGKDFVDRIVKAKYVKRNDGYTLGENLAWGTGDYSTPRGVVQAWMNSKEHRANLLRKSYRDVGIGIRLGVPSDAGVGATFTVDFGVKA